MRVLFVSAFVPSRIKVRPYHWLKLLSAEHQVTLIAPLLREPDRESAAELKDWCERIVAVPVSKVERFGNYLRGLATDEPLQVRDVDTGQMRAAVAHEVAHGFDVAHIEHLRAAPFAAMLPLGLARVCDAIDSISLLVCGMARHGPSWPLRAAARFEMRRTLAYEARILSQFDRVLVASERDRAAFKALSPELADASVRVLSNGVDLEYFAPITVERDSETLLVSGTMNYHPNVSAVLYLAREVLPHIWARRPFARLLVVGADPTAEIRALSRNPRIEVTGFVPDIRPYLARATVAISPTTYGAGIQNKVLEAMAMGTPVVASPNSAAGLKAQPGREYLLAEGAQGVAGAILELIGQPEQAHRIGEAGRAYVEREHNWHEKARQLTRFFHEARDARRAPPSPSGRGMG